MRKEIRDILRSQITNVELRSALERVARTRTRAEISRIAASRQAVAEATRQRKLRVIERTAAREAKQREIEAKAEEFLKNRKLRELATRIATGMKCSQKACPFPAVMDGECRKHVIDRQMQTSIMPSTLAAVQQMSIYNGEIR